MPNLFRSANWKTFSLRSLFLVITVSCIGFAVYSQFIREAELIKFHKSRIENLNGIVHLRLPTRKEREKNDDTEFFAFGFYFKHSSGFIDLRYCNTNHFLGRNFISTPAEIQLNNRELAQLADSINYLTPQALALNGSLMKPAFMERFKVKDHMQQLIIAGEVAEPVLLWEWSKRNPQVDFLFQEVTNLPKLTATMQQTYLFLDNCELTVEAINNLPVYEENTRWFSFTNCEKWSPEVLQALAQRTDIDSLSIELLPIELLPNLHSVHARRLDIRATGNTFLKKKNQLPENLILGFKDNKHLQEIKIYGAALPPIYFTQLSQIPAQFQIYNSVNTEFGKLELSASKMSHECFTTIFYDSKYGSKLGQLELFFAETPNMQSIQFKDNAE